jgi:hypothetical protein
MVNSQGLPGVGLAGLQVVLGRGTGLVQHRTGLGMFVEHHHMLRARVEHKLAGWLGHGVVLGHGL